MYVTDILKYCIVYLDIGETHKTGKYLLFSKVEKDNFERGTEGYNYSKLYFSTFF